MGGKIKAKKLQRKTLWRFCDYPARKTLRQDRGKVERQVIS